MFYAERDKKVIWAVTTILVILAYGLGRRHKKISLSHRLTEARADRDFYQSMALHYKAKAERHAVNEHLYRCAGLEAANDA